MVAHDQDQNLQVRPVGLRDDLHRLAVGAVGQLAHLPLDKAAKEAAAGAARSLPGNSGEVLEGDLEVIEPGESEDEAGVAGGGGGEASSSGEVVDGADVDLVVSQSL